MYIKDGDIVIMVSDIFSLNYTIDYLVKKFEAVVLCDDILCDDILIQNL